MSSPYKPKGIYSAQWIPTDAAGRIDRQALASLIEFERGHGIHGFLALGSTGEFPQFSVEERKQVLKAVVEMSGGLPVLANITDIRPKAAIELGLYAKELGVKAVGLMPPMFYPVSQADQLAYFLHVADKVGLPVMLYNFPELTGKRIDLSTIAAFADRAPMCAIKQSGGEFAYHRELVALGKEKGYVVMSGADTRLSEVFSVGAAGAIGGLVNIVPELMVLLYRVCAEGQKGEIKQAAETMVEVGRIVDQLTFPLNVAAGIEARGLPPGVPKMIVSPESRSIYQKILVDLRALFAKTNLPVGTPVHA
ncbi:MAG TPA: dihydrodipicolinate synthase family protein [Opitutaceae bacterium]|nr:dihydrodipicolinate synthase family protein [Opitutaceae bacterium]